MRLAAALLSLTLMTSLGCQSDDAWYRADEAAPGLLVARADVAADTCFVLRIAPRDLVRPEDVIEGIKVDSDDVVVAGLFERGDARTCETQIAWPERLEHVEASGRVRLEGMTVDELGNLSACRVDLKLEIGGVRFRVEDQYVWGSGCEPLPSDTIHYSNLSAAASFDGELVIAGWDATNQACAWMKFVNLDWGDSPIAVPDGWVLNRSAVSDVSEDLCDATTIADTYNAVVKVSSLRQFGGGTIEFVETRPSSDDPTLEVPCVIDVDAWTQHTAYRYWVPERAAFSGTLEVEGACP